MNSTEVLPENLIVSVRIPKSNKSSITLPKAAILSNEIETDYCHVTKNDSTAVKVPVQIGLKSRKNRNNFAKFKGTDRIVTLKLWSDDTIKVKLQIVPNNE
jgi:hypothetical protein